MGLPQAATAGSALPQVLVTAAPLQPIADALLVGIGHSRSLTQGGQDPHTLALAPSQAKALQNADIIITPDRDMHPAIADILDKREKAGVVIISLTALEGADALPYPSSQHWLDDDHQHEPSVDMLDPHLWLDPLRVAAMAEPLAEAMGEKAPSQRALMVHNAQAFATHLRNEVNPALEEILAERSPPPKFVTKEFIPFLTAHRAYQYFLARYDIRDEGAIITRPEEYLGARSMRDALARASKVRVGCVIAEQNAGWAKKIAGLSEARMVILQPEQLPVRTKVPQLPWIDNDYDRLLYSIASGFAPCL